MIGNTYGEGWAACEDTEGISLSSIVGSDSVTEEGLLFAEPFSVCFGCKCHASRQP